MFRNIAVLLSGNGSNLKAIIDKGIKVSFVASNYPKAFGLKIAKNANIPSYAWRKVSELEEEVFKLIIDYDVRIDKEDKNLSNKYTDDLDFIIKDKLVISGNVNDYKSNDKVKELYNDTMDYKKYKINLKRTEMTSQY